MCVDWRSSACWWDSTTSAPVGSRWHWLPSHSRVFQTPDPVLWRTRPLLLTLTKHPGAAKVPSASSSLPCSLLGNRFALMRAAKCCVLCKERCARPGIAQVGPALPWPPPRGVERAPRERFAARDPSVPARRGQSLESLRGNRTRVTVAQFLPAKGDRDSSGWAGRPPWECAGRQELQGLLLAHSLTHFQGRPSTTPSNAPTHLLKRSLVGPHDPRGSHRVVHGTRW